MIEIDAPTECETLNSSGGLWASGLAASTGLFLVVRPSLKVLVGWP